MRSLFGSLVSRVKERKNVVDLDSLLLRNFGLGTKSGVTVSVETALGVATVLACTKALAEGISQIPLRLMQENDAGQKTVVNKHPAYRVLVRRPNEWMTSFGYRETLMYHAVLCGNHFSYKNIVRGNLRELIPIPPGFVRIIRNTDYSLQYVIMDPSGGVIGTFGRDKIFHVTGPTWNSYSGMEQIRLAREAIGLAIAAEENHSAMHRNGSQVGGLLTTDQKLDDISITRIKNLWNDAHAGGQNKFATTVLDGNLKYTPMAMKGVDAEHLATREFQGAEICRAMGVFPMIVGYADKTATFASAESFFTSHVILTLGPWVQRVQDTLNTQILTDQEMDQGMFWKLFTAGLHRGDMATRYAGYQQGILTGWMTRNEARSLEDMNRIEGLDDPLVPLNMGSTANEPDTYVPGEEDQPDIDPDFKVNRRRRRLNGNPTAVMPKSVLDLLTRENIGRVISAKTEGLIRSAQENLTVVLDQLETQIDEPPSDPAQSLTSKEPQGHGNET